MIKKSKIKVDYKKSTFCNKYKYTLHKIIKGNQRLPYFSISTILSFFPNGSNNLIKVES